ncbi:hypothetical protein WMF30_10180 [Sorangium sp. So ce134]
MSLERYFQRAHDEARRLLREKAWLARLERGPGTWWHVDANEGEDVSFLIPATTPEDAVRALLSKRGRRAMKRTGGKRLSKMPPTVIRCVYRVHPESFMRILDRAMVDTDGSPTLAAGEGAEARRLLEMVAWDAVPQARWPDVFDALRMAAAAREVGLAPDPVRWEATLLEQLDEDGWLATAERSAA